MTFVNNQEQCRIKWKESVSECIRLKAELDICNTRISEFEKKLNGARVLLDMEKKRTSRAEKERDELVSIINFSSMVFGFYLMCCFNILRENK